MMVAATLAAVLSMAEGESAMPLPSLDGTISPLHQEEKKLFLFNGLRVVKDQHVSGGGIGRNGLHPGELMEMALNFQSLQGRPLNLGKLDPQPPFQGMNIGGNYSIHGNHLLYRN